MAGQNVRKNSVEKLSGKPENPRATRKPGGEARVPKNTRMSPIEQRNEKVRIVENKNYSLDSANTMPYCQAGILGFVNVPKV